MVVLRHEPAVVARDGDESLYRCERCSALGFADAISGFLGGRIVEDECPHEEAPATTTLGFLYGSRVLR
jgi:hypothetical protein